LADYTCSGVGRLLDRRGLRVRSARGQQFSPHPPYPQKLIHLEVALWGARRYPRSGGARFPDGMGVRRRPAPAPRSAGAPPPPRAGGGRPRVAARRGANNGLGRLLGGLNALTGQVNYVAADSVGRAKVKEFYGQLVEAYPQARRLYVIQDNWSIHSHPDVVEA